MSDQQDQNEDCPICFVNLKDASPKTTMRCCRNIFHFDCLIAWCKKSISTHTCPMCRAIIIFSYNDALHIIDSLKEEKTHYNEKIQILEDLLLPQRINEMISKCEKEVMRVNSLIAEYEILVSDDALNIINSLKSEITSYNEEIQEYESMLSRPQIINDMISKGENLVMYINSMIADYEILVSDKNCSFPLSPIKW